VTAKQLAKMMINGDLDYKPENDAHWIAEKYIQLHDAVMESFNELPVETMKKLKVIMCEDPAADRH